MTGSPAAITIGALATTRPTSRYLSAIMRSEIPEAHDDSHGPADEAEEDAGSQKRTEGTDERPDPAADEPAEHHPAEKQHPGHHPPRRVLRRRLRAHRDRKEGRVRAYGATGGGTLDDKARTRAGSPGAPSPAEGSVRRLLQPIEFFDFVTTL